MKYTYLLGYSVVLSVLSVLGSLPRQATGRCRSSKGEVFLCEVNAPASLSTGSLIIKHEDEQSD